MNWPIHFPMRFPVFGLAYVVTGIVCGFWWFPRREQRSVLLPLSGVFLAIAALNVYAEQRGIPGRIRFQDAGVILIGAFLLPYSTLCVRLMEGASSAKGRAAFRFSFLSPVYLLALGMLLNLRQIPTSDNPAFTIYVFLVFASFIHIPIFAFGKGRAIKAQGNMADLQKPHSGDSAGLLRQVITALGLPLLVTCIVQVEVAKGWTLFCLNILMALALLSLFLISLDCGGTLSRAAHTDFGPK